MTGSSPLPEVCAEPTTGLPTEPTTWAGEMKTRWMEAGCLESGRVMCDNNVITRSPLSILVAGPLFIAQISLLQSLGTGIEAFEASCQSRSPWSSRLCGTRHPPPKILHLAG